MYSNQVNSFSLKSKMVLFSLVQKKTSIVVFSDLDATLLDHASYSHEAARPALRLLEREKIPIILCSSKTAAEIERLRDSLRLHHPFISENGGAIFIPRGYFPFSFMPHRETPRYLVIELGTSYSKLREVLGCLQHSYPGAIQGFGDMAVEEVARLTNLSLEDACLAKQREYDEPFLLGNEELASEIAKRVNALGLQVTKGGRFHHLMGGNDKGRAVSILTSLFRRQQPDLVTIGIGDSLNDLAMLMAVDYPVLVQKPDGSYDPAVRLPNLILAPFPGPDGFRASLVELVPLLIRQEFS